MGWKEFGIAAAAAGAATLVYGALVESKRLVLERQTLALPGWPRRLDGFRIAVLGDLHLRDKYSLELCQRAIAMALDESPDMVALVGDYVGYWKAESPWLIGEALTPLMAMMGNVVAVPGNHDYWLGTAAWLRPIMDELNIKLLRNEHWEHEGIEWVGIDSLNAKMANPYKALLHADKKPEIVLWHEPDAVDYLPTGASLMLSGHSHGGQFRFPGGFTPMHTDNGRRYVRGFYPEAPTPLYVTRGVGTTGPPSRFLCPPEVSLLTLVTA